MSWVLEHVQILLGVAAAIAYFLNRKRAPSADAPRTDIPEREGSPELAERTRQVQERIRKLKEQRTAPPEGRRSVVATAREHLPPLVKPAEVRPLDPFGGPMRRILRELENAAQQRAEPDADRAERERAAVLERQQKLAEEMRRLEAARVHEQRRAAELAAQRRVRAVGLPAATVSPDRVIAELRDPRAIRRAIVLREVLGPPVALR